jgi:hypothetical protein
MIIKRSLRKATGMFIRACQDRPASSGGWGTLLLLALAGCGGPRLYPVEGTIQFTDGQVARELAGASVEFDPLEGKAGARGTVGPDGRFRLGTDQPGDGAVPGTYRVCIQPPLPDLDRPAARVLDRRYQSLATTDLKVTVKAEPNHLVLTVERAPAKR